MRLSDRWATASQSILLILFFSTVNKIEFMLDIFADGVYLEMTRMSRTIGETRY